ncbi:MAG: PBP1A family penicillin-binding protein, partial [Candidatus Heimdallarchaeota archaeon]|nr:PBP1A family penicillin-binding protein [Candidatus Heimdallarchaeota archaeon]
DSSFLAEYAYEKRLYLDIEYIPKTLINAIVSAEDKSFYTNMGIDFLGILRAFKNNLYGDSSKLSGGSTITQQVVKNLLLTNEQSLKRKIKEAILAFKISYSLSKDKIMELYLNKIYLGNSAYGIVTAALYYFNKSIYNLTLEEEALIAALPQAPSRLNPLNNNKDIIHRRNWVLDRMVEDEYITEKEARIAKNKPIRLNTSYKLSHNHKADFLISGIRKEMIDKYSKDQFYEEGFSIYSNIIPSMQNAAHDALNEYVLKYDKKLGWRGAIDNIKNIEDKNWLGELKNYKISSAIKEFELGIVLESDFDNYTARVGLKNAEKEEIVSIDNWVDRLDNGDIIALFNDSGKYKISQIPEVNGAIVVMNPRNGKILAMSGGVDYEKNKFNLATQAYRQPGSLIKPFIYLSALENNFTLSTIIEDEELHIFQGDNLPLWEPQNYEKKFFGATSLREGIEQSHNATTIQLSMLLGLEKLNKTFRKFGIYNHDTSNYSVALGSNEVTLLDMMKAYAVIFNNGYTVKPNLISYVQDRNGNVIINNSDIDYTFNYQDESNNNNLLPNIKPVTRNKIISSDIAYQAASVLFGAVEHGTSRMAKMKGFEIGGKTGTSNDAKDTWFIGGNQDILVGVYVGYNKPKSLGNKATGARLAIPIFKKFMNKIKNQLVSAPFPIPE